MLVFLLVLLILSHVGQDYVTGIPTNKAHQDHQFPEKLFERKRKSMEKAQENLCQGLL